MEIPALFKWMNPFQIQGLFGNGESLLVVTHNSIQILEIHSVSIGARPDQTPRSGASGVVLLCPLMFHKKDAWLTNTLNEMV